MLCCGTSAELRAYIFRNEGVTVVNRNRRADPGGHDASCISTVVFDSSFDLTLGSVFVDDSAGSTGNSGSRSTIIYAGISLSWPPFEICAVSLLCCSIWHARYIRTLPLYILFNRLRIVVCHIVINDVSDQVVLDNSRCSEIECRSFAIRNYRSHIAWCRSLIS